MEYDKVYFEGKIAAVTGSASGIGLALCEELLESGAAKVLLVDLNKDNLLLHKHVFMSSIPAR